MSEMPKWVMANTVESDAGCLIWTGFTHKNYARYNGQQASRVAYRAVVGAIPDDLELDHLCRRPQCVNPRHLEPVTRAENMRRRNELITHCKRGHGLDEANTYTGCGRRQCRKCQQLAVARYKARKRSELRKAS